MRKTFILVLLLFLSFGIVDAQIQKTLLGVTLGTSTRNNVKEIYPTAYRNISGDIDHANYPGSELHGRTTKGEPALNQRDVKFAGIEWDFVGFSFYQTVLCEIEFTIAGNANFKSWKDLCLALTKKYSSYKKKEAVEKGDWGKFEYKIYSDGTTRVILCSYFKTSGQLDFYTLSYQNVTLFRKKYQNKVDSSEL